MIFATKITNFVIFDDLFLKICQYDDFLDLKYKIFPFIKLPQIDQPVALCLCVLDPS